MKLLLSGDNYVYQSHGKYFAADQESFDLFCRYLSVFERVRLVTRCIPSSSIDSSWIPLDNEPRIEFFPLPIFHGPKEYLKVFFKIRKLAKKSIEGCDAAVLRVPSTVAMVVGKFVKNTKIPYATEVVYDAEDGWRLSSGLNRIIWKKIDNDLRMLCYYAEGVSCVTEHYMQRNYFSKKKNAFYTHYSSLALPMSFYSTTPKKYPQGKSFVIAHTSKQIQFNGRKGHKELVSAISLLNKKGVNVGVKFAGADYENGIKKLQQYARQLGIEEKLEFVGYLDKTNLSSFLESSDLFVLPTKAEGLPRVIIEAMAKALPCISTNVSGIVELLDEEYLVKNFYDIDSLSSCIEKIVKHPGVYESASEKNLKKSLEYEESLLQKRRIDFYFNLRKRI